MHGLNASDNHCRNQVEVEVTVDHEEVVDLVRAVRPTTFARRRQVDLPCPRPPGRRRLHLYAARTRMRRNHEVEAAWLQRPRHVPSGESEPRRCQHRSGPPESRHVHGGAGAGGASCFAPGVEAGDGDASVLSSRPLLSELVTVSGGDVRGTVPVPAVEWPGWPKPILRYSARRRTVLIDPPDVPRSPNWRSTARQDCDASIA